jgi:2-polyprenyl-6-methoxyphenol hydroxylase-like FAD-dependent oxidoreductase
VALRKLQIIIIGAGTGGLSLAHGLRAANIDVRVFERDQETTDRAQGYRLTINATGARALRSCLPRENFERYIAASAKVSTGVSFFDHQLHRLLSIDLPPTDQSAPDAARPISRTALRQTLLEGLDEVVAFGKTFVDFETLPDGQAIARFEDGSTAQGDLLIGADGASSRVRRQLLPQAQRMNTGLVMISGKVPLDATTRSEAPPAVFKGPTMILGPRGGFMFSGAVEYPADCSSDHDRDEYVMWGFSARGDQLGVPGTPEELSAEDARAAVLSQIVDWNPALRRLVERAAPASVTSFAVKSSVPIGSWTTSQVTLLGDALHNMTPFRGIGANTALRDAVLLRDSLVQVKTGQRDLLPAISLYESGIIHYGFDAVRASLAQMNRVHARSPFRRFMAKTVFRLIDLSPTLQRRMVGLNE